MEPSACILETSHLGKAYGPLTALEDASLCFTDEKIYGLFGRNGAGKTTLLNIIAARIFPDRGRVTCFGQDIMKHPRVLAENCCYMPEKHFFPGRYTVRRLLALAASYFPRYNREYATQLCARFNLNREQKYEQLSRGHQSVLRIVLGLAAGARITIFDEPVLGLDAVARDRFYQALIEEFSRNPRLFIISTHLIDESADLFNEAIILKAGRVIRQDTVEDLLAGSFYVSGKAARVDEFLKERRVIDCRQVNNQKLAVVEGNLAGEERFPGLTYSPLTIQKLFIHLTDDRSEQEPTE